MTIPSNIRVPLFAVEFDNSQADQGPALLNYRALLIGQKSSGAAAADNAVLQVTSANQVATLCGRGSMLHRMAIRWFSINKFTETWIGVLADNGAGVQAVGNVSFTGPATASGTVNLYFGGALVQLPVASGDTAATMATNLAALLPSVSDLPVTGAVDGTHNYQVNATFRHKGAVGNDLNIRYDYRTDEALPAGVGVTVTPMASGVTNPVLTTLISNLGDTWFNVIAHPYTDSTSLTAIENELADRFGPLRMIDGVAITAKDDTVSNLGTLGNGRNSPHSVIVEATSEPMPCYEKAAQVAAQVAAEGAADPARPFHTLPLPDLLAPAQADQLMQSERNTLLYDGISTTKVAFDGTVQIERLITTYKTNAVGAADDSYLRLETMLTIMYLRYSLRQRFLTKYPRHKLADDSVSPAPGQPILTPSIAKAECVAWFQQMQDDLGLVQDLDSFKANLTVAIDSQNPDRLNMLVPPTLIGQFVVGAADLQFRL